MRDILFWAGALVLLSVLSPVLKFIIAALAGKQVGAAALAQQPDQITLVRGSSGSWKNAAGARKWVDPLVARGFTDAGVHTIAEMPGVVVQLLAQPQDGLYAALCEHPQVGHWLDLVSRFQDGTSVTFTTSRPTALKPRPGHHAAHHPGLDASALLEKALALRPRRVLDEVSAGRAVEVFERAYAEMMAYRKGVGISTEEVVGTALRKAA